MRTNRSKKEETEKCILCGRDTGVLKTTPIKQRTHYIVGCGQLCEECGRKLTHKSVIRR